MEDPPAHQCILGSQAKMPIGDIPCEVLQGIFQHLLDSHSPAFVNPPCRVAEVCRLWQAVALSMSNIRCVFPLVTLDNERHTFQANAKTGRRLTLSMRGVIIPQKNSISIGNIFNKSAQWRHAELELDADLDFDTVISIKLMAKVPLLHTLKVKVHTDSVWFLGHINAFEIAPSLRRLEIDCSRIRFTAPFHQLEEYVEKSYAPIGIHQVLAPDSNIRSLSYKSDVLFCHQSPAVKIVRHLTSLNLLLRNPSIKSFLSHLIIPSLACLRVVSDSHNILDDVRNMVLRSGCTLTTLSLRTTWDPRSSQFQFHSAEVGDAYLPLLLACSGLQNPELDQVAFKTLQTILCPSAASFLPHLREVIAHLPNAPPTPFTALHEDVGIRTVPFVRLVFPSANERAEAHRRLEALEPLTPSVKLQEIANRLSCAVVCMQREASASSYQLDGILSDLKQARPEIQDPWQMIVSLSHFLE